MALLKETGGVEVVTLLLLGAIAVWSRAPAAGRPAPWTVTAVIVLLGLRELDFHDWFFEPGWLQIRIFSAPVPAWQKAVSAVAMLAVLGVLLSLAAQGTRPFLRALRRRADWALWLVAGTALAAAATVIDGIGRKLAPHGIALSERADLVFAGFEETMELVFVLCVAVAIARWRAASAPRG